MIYESVYGMWRMRICADFFYYQSIKIRVHLLSLRRPRANTRFEDIYAGHCKVLTMPIIHTLECPLFISYDARYWNADIRVIVS